MNSKKSNAEFVGGALWLAISAVILKVIGVFYKIPLSYILGDEGMGYFNSAYTVYTFFYIIGSTGIPKAISIISARFEAEGKSAYPVYRSAFAFFAAAGFILSATFFVFASRISFLIGSRKAYFSMLLISPSVLFVCAMGVARGYLNGKLMFSHIAVSELISGLLKLILGISLSYRASRLGYGVEISSALAILGITIGALLGMLYLLIAVNMTETNRTKFKYSYKYKGIIKEILKLGLPMTLASAIGSVASIIDLVLIMNGLSESGYSEGVATVLYGNFTTLALPIFSLVATVVGQFSSAALPIMTKGFAEGTREIYKDSFNRCLTACAFVVFPAFFVMLTFPEELLSVLFEHTGAVLGAHSLAILSPGVLFLGLLTVFNTAHEASGRVRLTVVSLLSGAIAKLIVSIVFIKNTGVGILAAPLGTSVSYAVALIISSFGFFISYKNKVSLFASIKGSMFTSAAALFMTLIFARLVNVPVPRIKGVVILFVYAVVYLFLSYILHTKRAKKQYNTADCTKSRRCNY